MHHINTSMRYIMGSYQVYGIIRQARVQPHRVCVTVCNHRPAHRHERHACFAFGRSLSHHRARGTLRFGYVSSCESPSHAAVVSLRKCRRQHISLLAMSYIARRLLSTAATETPAAAAPVTSLIRPVFFGFLAGVTTACGAGFDAFCYFPFFRLTECPQAMFI